MSEPAVYLVLSSMGKLHDVFVDQREATDRARAIAGLVTTLPIVADFRDAHSVKART